MVAVGVVERTEMLCTQEVATKLKCSDATVRRMCEDGLFPNARRLRRSSPWQIPESDVDAHLEKTKPKVLRRAASAA